MPEVVISSRSGASTAPPPAALQPSMRILKRPSAAPVPDSTSSSPALEQKTFADREAQYQAARERIFGDASSPSSNSIPGTPTLLAKPGGSSSTSANTSSQPSRQSTPQVAAVNIIRDPRGPDPADAGAPGRGNSRGFRGRRGANSAHATGQGVAK